MKFLKSKKDKSGKKILFAVIIGVAVVCFWRGVWGLLDVYLFPNNYALSSWISVIAGLIVLRLMHHLYRELTD